MYPSAAGTPGRLAVATGFGLGDGVFETIAFRQNRIEYARDHLARLRTALAYFAIAGAPDDDTLLVAIRDLLSGSPAGGTYRIRLTVVRLGQGASTEIAFAPYEAPHHLPPLKVATVIRPAGNPSSRFKTLAYADLLAGQREVGPGATALFLNQWGRVACATYGNVYALVDDCWVTPAVEEGALPGIVRGQLLRTSAYDGSKVLEGQVTVGDLRRSRLLYSNSLVGVMEVRWA